MYKNFNLMVLFILTCAVIACKSDPYSTEGVLQEEKPKVPPTSLPVFSLSVLDRVEFKEGMESKLYVTANVVKGKPIFTFEGLPAGAQFVSENETSGNIVWKPDYQAANDPADPTIKSKNYTVKVEVRSDEDSITYNRKEVLFTVTDSPRRMNIVTSKSGNVKEGVKYKHALTVESEDFPNGPFRVEFPNLPQSAEIKKVTDNKYEIEFTPGYDFVSHNKTGTFTCGVYFCKTVKFDANAYAPSGQVFSIKDIELWVQDERISPLFTAPKKVEQGPDVSFSVSSLDLNYETKPEIKIMEPPFGKVSLEMVPTSIDQIGMNQYATSMIVKWEDIPLNKMGTIQKLTLQSCVWGTTKTYNKCQDKIVEVQLDQVDRPFPMISRQSWPVSKMEYALIGETKNYSVSVSPGSGEVEPVKVYIEPASMLNEVKWSNGTLKITPTVSGLKAFSIVAVSAFNVKTTETFYLEALPAQRSETLFLGSIQSTPESTAYQTQLASVDLFNPKYQELDDRLLYKRKNLLLSTEALQDPELIKKIDLIKSKFTNIIISSPAISQITGELKNELGTLGVSVFKKLKDIPNPPLLNEIQVQAHARSPLTHAKMPVGLQGTLTSLSASPALLQLANTTQCTEAIAGGLVNDPTRVFLMGVTCKRSNGGKLVVLGFELPDSKLDPQDKDLVKLWFGELLK